MTTASERLGRTEADRLTPKTELEDLPDHLCALQPGRWALWRQVGVRATGFPISGLDAFGGPDEAGRLRQLAGDPRFREAVTWQNRAALRNAVAKLGSSEGRDDSTTRRRLDVVASYWQRYCSKNETIGFFGPMGWATLVDGVGAVTQEPGPQLVAERNVRFEVWAVQALAQALSEDQDVRRWLPPRRRPDRLPTELTPEESVVYAACDGRTPAWQVGDPALLESLVERQIVQWDLRVPLGPHPERHVRATLERIGDSAVRARVIAVLDDLEEGRAAVAQAAGDPDELGRALDDLDNRFSRSTGVAPGRAAGAAYGGRTLCYEDCRRDIDVRLGEPLRRALGEALLPLLPGARWYCGQVAGLARRMAKDALDCVRAEMGTATVPALDVWSRVVPRLIAQPPAVLHLRRELQSRFASLLECGTDQLAERAEAEFDDAPLAWRQGLYMSPDVQICASGSEAIDRGDFLVVVGDFHPGTVSMEQCFILEQHPDPDRLRRFIAADVQPPRLFPVPSSELPRTPRTAADDLKGGSSEVRSVAGSTWSGRSVPGYTLPDDLCLLTAPDTLMPDGYRTVHLADLVVSDGADGPVLETRDGQLRFPLEEAFWLHTFLLAFWTYDPFAATPHSERVTVGRAVLRRETWNPPVDTMKWALSSGGTSSDEVRVWARSLGMPKRVFVLAPVEAKPFYVDFDSPSLTRVLRRMARRSAEAYGPEVTLRFTEMLPTPDQTWLLDAAGNRYASELRLVVTDLTRWPSRSPIRSKH
ncbi:MAG: lantibiotic dehydratase family protein [Actinomycetota bacterium]|nr:lantibiotic dehydratase family protein [Actinomycetota bacterium]